MPNDAPVVLVTGGAHRIGAAIVAKFHHNNYRVIVHYRNASDTAHALVAGCNAARPESACCLQADFTSADAVAQLASDALQVFGRLDVLVNNASSYYPTLFGSVSQTSWDDLMDSNLRGAFFLSQACADELQHRHGAIVNVTDSHTDKPMLRHSVYSIAKVGLHAMTRALARELAPQVRVNAIAPGAILWSTGLADDSDPSVADRRDNILKQIPLGCLGSPQTIADAVYFLAVKASYMTGTVLRVDGGRFLNL